MFKKLDEENEEQFIWRIGQAKDSGLIDMSWNDIADTINIQYRNDESEYRTEAAYRKAYQQAKRFYEAGVFDAFKEDKYLKELREQKYEIKKEKQRLSDERTALNRSLRSTARVEEDLSILKNLISKNSKTTLPPVNNYIKHSDNDLIIALSDFHLGLETDTYFGSYNSNIAKDRLWQYLNAIIEIAALHKSENAYLILLGDLLNGEIHFTTQLENRENLTKQIQKTAELISAFTYELSKHFNIVYVNGVAGNHSRTSYKDQVLRENRLDNLIPWYMKAKLEHIDKIKFMDWQNYDATIGSIKVRDNEYIIVHGDFDKFNESGVSKLVMMLGFKPTAIFYGHLHRCSYDEVSDIKIIRSGSFCGTYDDYTVSKRFSGKPSQMVCVADKSGIKAYYPIELK